jgi:hypothetical protein
MSTPQNSAKAANLTGGQTNWNDERLRELHVERGWPATDIAREIGGEAADVRDRLKQLDVFQGQTHPPKSGLARKVWEAGMENGGELP